MNYVITGVWFSISPQRNGKFITHVMLHQLINNKIQKGRKENELYVLGLIDQGKSVYTCIWDYVSVNWKTGAQVKIEHVDGRRILRTVLNNKTSDNLDNLIDMQIFPL